LNLTELKIKLNISIVVVAAVLGRGFGSEWAIQLSSLHLHETSGNNSMHEKKDSSYTDTRLPSDVKSSKNNAAACADCSQHCLV
jgi:hypothetical protein